jgi:hypothetical protein
MRSRRHAFTRGFDRCEARLALSNVVAVPPPIVTTTTSGPTIAPILSEYANAYLSAVGSAKYNPAADANHNGVVAMGDALPLLRTLAPTTSRSPLRLTLTLARGDQVNTPHPANSGGVTRQSKTVTIIGHTVPNSLVFTDDPNNDFRFRGGSVIPVDSAGFFSETVTFTSPYKLNQHNFLVIDPFGAQLRRAFPILQLPS